MHKPQQNPQYCGDNQCEDQAPRQLRYGHGQNTQESGQESPHNRQKD